MTKPHPLLRKALLLTLSAAIAGKAAALSVTPASTSMWTGPQPGINPNTSNNAILNWIQGQFDPDLIEYYKGTPSDSSESGSMAPYYASTFNGTSDSSGGTITHSGGLAIASTANTPAYLLIKDGNHVPYWYFYNLTALGWNGLETLELSGFWPGSGSISHVSILGNDVTPVTTPPVRNTPEGGSSISILGAAACGLAGLRRMHRRR